MHYALLVFLQFQSIDNPICCAIVRVRFKFPRTVSSHPTVLKTDLIIFIIISPPPRSLFVPGLSEKQVIDFIWPNINGYERLIEVYCTE